jgi:hypothetical protein
VNDSWPWLPDGDFIVVYNAGPATDRTNVERVRVGKRKD